MCALAINRSTKRPFRNSATTRETTSDRSARPRAQRKGRPAEIPDELLDQVLADATTCEAIETMLNKAGVKEPLKTLPRETQRQAVTAFLVMLERLKGNEAAPD